MKETTTNLDKLVAPANKYTDPQELTPELFRTFIDKIVIHARSHKWSKKGVQQIDIYFRHIGCIGLPGAKEKPRHKIRAGQPKAAQPRYKMKTSLRETA